jgi:hypothetical protein
LADAVGAMAGGDDLRYGLPLAREILARLRGGRQPTARDLEDAALIAQWRLRLRSPADPYLLEGRIGTRTISEVLIAIDPAVGWARTIDHWFVLEEPDRSNPAAASPDDVMQAAAAWIDRQLGNGTG